MQLTRLLDTGVTQPLDDLGDDPQYNDAQFVDAELEYSDICGSVDAPVTRPRRLSSAAASARMALCGTFRKHFDPLNGSFTAFRIRCGRKDCPDCGMLRGWFLQKRVEQPFVRVSELATADAIALRRQLGMANYVNVPLNADKCLVFWRPKNHPEITVEARVFTHDEFQWQLIQNTPDGLNISGGLNRYEPNRQGEFVTIPQVTFQESPLTETLVNDAIVKTITTLPGNIAELQQAISTRTGILLENLTRAKVAYELFFVKKRIEFARVDWGIGVAAYVMNLMRSSSAVGQTLHMLPDLQKVLATCSPTARIMLEKLLIT